RIQHVWEVATGRELIAYTDHRNSVIAAAIAPDGKLAATGGGAENEIRIWELSTGVLVKGTDGKPLVLAGTGAPVWASAPSADGRRIAWGNTWQHPDAEAANPLEFQLQLPVGGRVLGRPERISEAAAKDFVRARATQGDYALLHRKGGAYGYKAILDLKKG